MFMVSVQKIRKRLKFKLFITDWLKSRPCENSLAFCTSDNLTIFFFIIKEERRLNLIAFRSGEVQKSARNYSDGLDFTIA